jgi:hypothetical protein
MSRAWSARPASLLLSAVLLAVAALLLQGALLPHTHAGVGSGVYNQDHDLTLLATLHGAAVLAESPPMPPVFVLVVALALLAIGAPASAARPTFACRAPPLA